MKNFLLSISLLIACSTLTFDQNEACNGLKSVVSSKIRHSHYPVTAGSPTIHLCSKLRSILAAEKKNWLVVGAGPAGIAVVGLLIDFGVDPQDITWLDPEFNVGRLGKYYITVPGNATTQMYLDFMNSCKVFREFNSPAMTMLRESDLQTAYPLHIIINPLLDLTNYLRTRVNAIQSKIVSLFYKNDSWYSDLENGQQIKAYSVVLATGSHPKTLQFEGKEQISLDLALNKSLLEQYIQPEDTVGVIGSAHSAILLLKYLSEIPAARVINFYTKPIVYTVNMGTWVQHQNAGLKGVTAEWAREVLEKNPPAKIIRIFNKPGVLEAWLPICSKVICATGYIRNELPSINGTTDIAYDDTSGVIGQRLFGIGIAFPEKFMYPDGNIEHRVGLKFFMEYAQRIIPEWMKRDCTRFISFDSIFTIDVL